MLDENDKCPRLAPRLSHPRRTARRARAKWRRGEELTAEETRAINLVQSWREGMGRGVIFQIVRD